MQIKGQGNKIDKIKLKHKGQDANFLHIRSTHREDIAIKPSEVGLIEFEDIREIDLLIDTLQYFKEYCEAQIGRMMRIDEND